MIYKSYADMAVSIRNGRGRLPAKIDLVVGVPRSGMAPATFLSVLLNAPLADVDGFINDRLLEAGSTKVRPDFEAALSADRCVLVIDDCVGAGASIREIRRRIEASGKPGRIVYCAVYAMTDPHPDVDIVLDMVPHRPLFEWNFMHSTLLANACCDIDGVLCPNVPPAVQQQEALYAEYLRETPPLLTPSRKVGVLITGRREAYRSVTEDWTRRNRVSYDELVMVGDASESHGEAKARYYAQSPHSLFIESEYVQATAIADMSGKPVICIETNELLIKGSFSRSARDLVSSSAISRWKLWLRQLLGNEAYHMAKRLAGRRPSRTS